MKHTSDLQFRILACCSCRLGQDYVSELRPPTGLFLITQIIYEYGEPQWNDTDRGKPKNPKNDLSQGHFVHQNCYMD
jgi:hypothetical protein